MATNLTVDGAAQFPDSTSQLSSYGHLKNRIINGKMQIDQLSAGIAQINATSYTNNMCMYTIDRWIYSSIGTGTYSANVNQVIIGSGQYAKTALQFTANTAALQYSSNYSGFAQRIESIYTEDLMNSRLTISANITLGIQATVYWALYYPNTRDTHSQTPLDWYNDVYLNYYATPAQSYPVYYNCTQIDSGLFTATTTPQTYTFITAKMPAEVKNGLLLYFYVLTGSSQLQTFTLTDVSLEKGPTGVPAGWGQGYTISKSPIDNRSVREELNLCRRYLYCENIVNGSGSKIKTQTFGYTDAGIDFGSFSTSATAFWKLKIPMYNGPGPGARAIFMEWPWYQPPVSGAAMVPGGGIKVTCPIGKDGYNYVNSTGGTAYPQVFPLEFPSKLNPSYVTLTAGSKKVVTSGDRSVITGLKVRFTTTGAYGPGAGSPPYATPTIKYYTGSTPIPVQIASLGFRSEL